MKIKKSLRTLIILLLACTIPLFSQAADLRIVIFSVNSGDSSLIVFPNNKTMLIDTGVPDRTDDTVIPFLQRHNITHFDYFLGTHPHPDHMDGVPNLETAGYIDAATVFWDWNTFDYADTFTIEGTDWFIANTRDTALWGTDANFNSVSYRFEWNGFIYSGAGDEGDGSMDRYLNDYPALVPANVRNTAHHGYGPTSSAFLTALDADLYVVSCSTLCESYSAYKTIGNVATAVGGVRALTATCFGGGRGNVYIRVSSGSDWDYSYHAWNGTIPDFYTPTGDSKFISQSVPETLMPGESASVSITLQNTGQFAWTTADGHALASLPEGNTNWGMSQVPLPHDVAPGEQVTFNFDVTAPTNIAFYDFKWQMIDNTQADPYLKLFGSTSTPVPLDVTWPLVNLVQNPSFEEGGTLPDNWGNDADYTRSNEEAFDGTYSAKGTGSGSIGGIRQANIPLSQNTEYTLKFRAKRLTGGAGNMYFDTQDKFDTAYNTQFTLAATNGWETYQATFDSGSETAVTLRTYTSSDFNGTVYIDDVSLTSRDNYTIPNLPPIFTSSPVEYVDVDQTYTYNITTDDPDGDPVTLSSVDKPAWLTLAGSTLSGTAPSSPGTTNVTLRASDALGHTDQTFTIMISSPGNDDPVITSLPDTGIIEGQIFNYSIIAADPDGDPLTYNAPVKPGWLSLSGSDLTGTAPATTGQNPVTITVSDGTVTVTQQFVVVVFPTPQPDNLFMNGSFEDGASWPTGWSTDANAQWSSTEAQDGTKSLLVPTDIGSVSQSITVYEGVTYNLSLWINADGYSGTGVVVFDSWDDYDGPGECQFVTGSATTSGWRQETGSFTATNTAAVQFRIFSTAGAGGETYFDNIVLSTAGSGNATPVFTSVPVTDAELNQPYSYKLLAADAENDPLTFSASGLPTGISLSGDLISGTPTVAGNYPVTVTVDDGMASTNQNFTIAVTTSQVAVPDVLGVAQATAESTITGAGLSVGSVTTTNSGSIAAGNVISQNPTSGTQVDPGTAVNLVVSLGPALEGYDAWADENSVGITTGDDDGDGRDNLLEYATGGDPHSSLDVNIDPVLVKEGSQFKYSHKKRNDDPNLVYTVQVCTDLSAGDWTNASLDVVTNGTVGNFDNVSHTVPADQTQSYIRLQVENQ